GEAHRCGVARGGDADVERRAQAGGRREAEGRVARKARAEAQGHGAPAHEEVAGDQPAVPAAFRPRSRSTVESSHAPPRNSGRSVSVARRPPCVTCVVAANSTGPTTPASFSLTE